jgi:hypothetical protein
MLSESVEPAPEWPVDSALLDLKAQLPFPVHPIPRQQVLLCNCRHLNLPICSPSWSSGFPVDRFIYTLDRQQFQFITALVVR